MANPNGKAKKGRKLMTVSLDVLPVEHSKLTPKSAARWLEQDHDEWQWLLLEGFQCKPDKDLQSALVTLALDVKDMTAACAKVVRTGKPMRLDSLYDPKEGRDRSTVAHCSANVLHLLRVPLLVSDIGAVSGFAGALEKLATIAARELGVLVDADWEEREKAREEAREARDPYKRLDAIRENAKLR